MKNQYLNELSRFVGIFILIVAGLAAIGLVLYGLLGYFGEAHSLHRLIATGLIMLLPVAYWLGHREGRAHREGIERGIALKVGAQRQTAPAKIIAPPPQQPTWQSIVPPPVDIRIQQAHDDDVVVL